MRVLVVFSKKRRTAIWPKCAFVAFVVVNKYFHLSDGTKEEIARTEAENQLQ